MKKKTYIVSIYDSYEWIHTEQSYCRLFLLIKYQLKGRSAIVINPPLWLARKLFDWFQWRTLRSTDVNIEKFDPTKDQVTSWNAWNNFS